MSQILTEVDVRSANVVCPEPGEDVTAASLVTPIQALTNRTKNIYDGDTAFSGDKSFPDTVNLNDVNTSGTENVSGTLNITASGALTTNAASTSTFSGKAKLVGRSVLHPALVTLSDANHTVGIATATSTTVGKRFRLPNPAAPRTITLKSTSTAVPDEGETIEFVAPAVVGGGIQYTIQREDATVVATLVGPTVASSAPCFYLQVEFVAGVWRMGANSGNAYDGGSPDTYGVIPGVGA